MIFERNFSKTDYYLKQSDFQSYFSFDIRPYVELHSFLKKEIMVEEGAPFPYLYYLVTGKAKIYMSHKNGKITLINFIKAPVLIGEMGLLGVETEAKGIIAMEDCICLAIPLNPYQDIILKDAHFLFKVAKMLGEMTISRTEMFAKSSNYPFENRLAEFILLTEQNGCYLEKHTEVSEYLNVSYRHLLYVLNRFCQKKVLIKEGRKYLIGNRYYLEQLTKESAKD